MNITPFDKAILAAILAPLLVLADSWINSGFTVILTVQSVEEAAAAGVVLGIGVFLKGNKAAA